MKINTIQKYNNILHLVCVSYEFGGSRCYHIHGRDRAIKFAKKLDSRACGETISIENGRGENVEF